MKVEISKVPENIRDQFGSEQTTALLLDINDRLYISNFRAIPHVLFLLETKALPAHDFINSVVGDAKITEGEAKAVAKEIKEKMLEPMRYALFQWGVDISDIKTTDAPNLNDIAPKEAKEEPAERKTIEITDIGKPDESVSIPVQATEERFAPAKKEITSTPMSDMPFIIHEEKGTETAGGEKKTPFRGFSIPLGFFKPKNKSADSVQSERAKVEAPAKNERRVVNYSELRTSLSPFEGQQSFINIEKPDDTREGVPIPTLTLPVQMEPAAPAVPIAKTPKNPEPAPAIIPETKVTIPDGNIPLEKPATGNILGMIKKTQPKVEGNIIDLS